MANGDIVVTQGTVRNDSLPGSTIDGNNANVRLSTYQEQFVTSVWGSKNYSLADEGSYFTICNPTAGTAIADGNASGFVATTPLMVIANTNATGGKSLYLDYLNLIVTTAAGTSSTNFVAAMYVDTGNRYSSGGSTITPNNPNIGQSNTTGASVKFGAVTATAATSSVRQIYNQILRTVIPVIGDNYQFRFGETAPAAAGMPLEGTLQVERVIQVPPVVIPPGNSFLLYTWGASQGTARQHTFVGGYWER